MEVVGVLEEYDDANDGEVEAVEEEKKAMIMMMVGWRQWRKQEGKTKKMMLMMVR